MALASFSPRDFAIFSDSLEAKVLADKLNALAANLATVETWADTLSTKLNADGGVTDTNYAGLTF